MEGLQMWCVNYRLVLLCFFLTLKADQMVHTSADFCRSKSDDCPMSDRYEQISAQNSLQFTAAVVEFYPEQDPNLTPELRLAKNVQHYITILSEIQQKIDIIIFPESTLAANALVESREGILPYTVEITDKFDGPSLCTSVGSATFLLPLACAAVSFNTYVVVNLLERAPCNENKQTQCSADGWDFYNTNVAFNRKGAVVAKYRKYNLFGEYYLNQTAAPDISIFEADFGVKFGLFTCFDILFRKPTLQLVKEHQINHIIYPAMWFSELPFLTALQAQQQWAYEVDAVFLTAGANNPKVGSGGSGIYQGKLGPIIFDISGSAQSRAYVATVPSQNTDTSMALSEDTNDIDILAKGLDNFFFKKDHLNLYTSKLVVAKQQQINEIVCSGEANNKICCNFDIAMEWDDKILQDEKNHYQYHMVAYSGVRSFSSVYNGGVEICGIVACTGATLDSCSQRFEKYDTVSWPATFTKISITANFKVDDNRIQHPNSLLSSIRPLPVDAIDWTHRYLDNNAIIERTYVLKKPQTRLMTFAIYGRDFNRDSDPLHEDDDDDDNDDGGNGASFVHSGFNCIVLFILLMVVM